MKRKIIVGVPLFVLGLVGLMGVLHLPFMRPVAMPLMAALGYDCPVRASPEEVEVARMASARAARGQAPSPARPALGFVLDRTSRAEVDAWAAARGVSCTPSQRGTVLRCTGVPAAAVGLDGGAIDDLSFAFDPASATLVTVTALRNQLDAATAAATLGERRSSLAAELGEGRAHGQATALYLAAAPMRTALVEYRFSDYIANLSATNLGTRVAVREHYMSAVD